MLAQISAYVPVPFGNAVRTVEIISTYDGVLFEAPPPPPPLLLLPPAADDVAESALELGLAAAVALEGDAAQR
jgi:hypothetical protein